MFLLEQGADPNAHDRRRAARCMPRPAPVGSWVDDWQRRHGVEHRPAGASRWAAAAARRGRRATCVKALLAKGADPNARITTSAMSMSYIGYPDEGRVRTVRLRHRRPARRDAALGRRLRRQRRRRRIRRRRHGRRRRPSERSGEVLKALLAAGADPHLTTVDGTTPLMVAAGLGRATFQPGLQRGRRSPSAEEAVNDPARRRRRHQRGERSRLHGAPRRGVPRPERSDQDPRGPRRQHQRARLSAAARRTGSPKARSSRSSSRRIRRPPSSSRRSAPTRGSASPAPCRSARATWSRKPRRCAAPRPDNPDPGIEKIYAEPAETAEKTLGLRLSVLGGLCI